MMSLLKRLRILQTEHRRKNNSKFDVMRREFEREKVLSPESGFQVREAYKILRTNVIFSLPQEGCKRICVTSSNASEGKSLNCLNLAITFAETGARVLIIDCDLRRPNVSKLLNRKAYPGLSNALVGLNDLNDVIQDSGFKNLDVIFSGNIPPNPAELLGSDNMKKFIDELSERYDYIFFDTAPVNVVTDTNILAKWMTGVIMVVLYNSTDRDTLEEAVKQLEFVGAKILGFILNGVVYGGGSYKYGGYKKRYKYYRYGKNDSYGSYVSNGSKEKAKKN